MIENIIYTLVAGLIFWLIYLHKLRIKKIEGKIDDIDCEVAGIIHPYKYKLGDKVYYVSTDLTDCGAYESKKHEGIVIKQEYRRNGTYRTNYYDVLHNSGVVDSTRENELHSVKDKGKKAK